MSHVLEAGAGHVGPGEGLDPSVRFMRPYPSEGLICGYEEMIVGALIQRQCLLLKVHGQRGIRCLQSVLILPCTPCLIIHKRS